PGWITSLASCSFVRLKRRAELSRPSTTWSRVALVQPCGKVWMFLERQYSPKVIPEEGSQGMSTTSRHDERPARGRALRWASSGRIRQSEGSPTRGSSPSRRQPHGPPPRERKDRASPSRP